MINHFRSIPLAAVLVCILGSSACQSEGDSNRPPTGASNESNSALSPLPDSSYETVSVIPGTDGSVAVIGKDNSIVVVQQNEKRPELTINSADGKSVKVEHPAGSRTTWMGDASVNEDWLVWTELRDTDATVMRWTMYAYSRLDGSVQRLMDAPSLEDGEAPPAPPGHSGHVVMGDWVYWPHGRCQAV